MASFETAYNTYIKPNEGGYANVAGDKGGETYAGIARNYHPNWPGWPLIDQKKAAGLIKHNRMFPDLQPYVDQFYRDWWNSKYFGSINNQAVADLLFDYNVNSSSLAIKAVQRIVGVSADGAMGPQTIAAINKMDAAKLHAALKEERRQLFERLAKQPSQAKFYDGWMARLSRFPDLVLPGMGIVAIAITIAAVGWILTNAGGTEKRKSSVGTARPVALRR